MTVRLLTHLIDRILRDWLTPPDDRPLSTKLSSSITNTDQSLSYDSLFLSPEAAEFIGPGTVIEIDREQITVGDVDEDANVFSDLIRGTNGTIATAHSANSEIIIAPTWPRQTIFEAVGDSIINLYPELFRVTYEGPYNSDYIALPSTVQDVLAVYQSTGHGMLAVDFHYSQFDPRFNSPSVTIACSTSGIYASCISKFSYPERETESLNDLGIPQEWEQLIIIGSLAYLIGKEDFDPVTVESVSEAIDQQGFPVRTGSAIRDSIIAYYEYLITRARRILLNQYGGVVLQRRGV